MTAESSRGAGEQDPAYLLAELDQRIAAWVGFIGGALIRYGELVTRV